MIHEERVKDPGAAAEVDLYGQDPRRSAVSAERYAVCIGRYYTELANALWRGRRRVFEAAGARVDGT